MLQSYEAIYDQGKLNWLSDAPKPEGKMRVIVTVVQEIPEAAASENIPPPELAGKMRILCDDQTLMEPVVPDEDWDALR